MTRDLIRRLAALEADQPEQFEVDFSLLTPGETAHLRRHAQIDLAFIEGDGPPVSAEHMARSVEICSRITVPVAPANMKGNDRQRAASANNGLAALSMRGGPMGDDTSQLTAEEFEELLDLWNASDQRSLSIDERARFRLLDGKVIKLHGETYANLTDVELDAMFEQHRAGKAVPVGAAKAKVSDRA